MIRRLASRGIRTWLGTIRLPLTVMGMDKESAPVRLYDRFASTVKLTAGVLLNDAGLAEEGRLQQVKADEFERAERLEEAARETRDEADAVLRQRRDEAEERREEATERARKRVESAQRRAEEERQRVRDAARRAQSSAQKRAAAREKVADRRERAARAVAVEGASEAVEEKRQALEAKREAQEIDREIEASKAARESGA